VTAPRSGARRTLAELSILLFGSQEGVGETASRPSAI
jgi:hypothetical protein